MNSIKQVKAKYIVTMNDKLDLIEDGCLVIQDKNIIDVGKYTELANKYVFDEIIDLKNKIILPGFINTHTHAAMSYFRGLADDLPLDDWLNKYIWPAEAKYINADFVRKATELSCLEMIKSGITCFADMYFFEDQVAQVAKNFGIRSVIGEGILNFPTPSSNDADFTFSIIEELISKYKDDDLVTVAITPHSIYATTTPILERCIQMARDNNAILHIHVSETKSEVENSLREHKLTPVQYLDKIGFLNENVLAAHSVWLDRSEMDIYSARKVKVSHNPASNLKLASGIAPVKDMLSKQIIIGLGTDGAASNNSFNMFFEMKLSALIHKGINLDPVCLPAITVLKMATINSAKCLSLDSKIGSIEVDKAADFIAIDLEQENLAPVNNIYSNLVYSGRPANISDVIINGQVIMRNRQMNIDEEKIIKNAINFKTK